MLEEAEVRSQKSDEHRTASPLANAVHGRSLLAVFAHPDDESLACGGLLAWCAALGARVSLLCVTHGEGGGADETGKPAGMPPTPNVRAAELRDAAGILGIPDVTVLTHEDGMLPWVEAGPLETSIRTTIARVRPDVVITFDADGLYWHPDHVAVHERTTAVVAALVDEAPALYYVSMPAGAMRAVVAHAAAVALGRDPDATPPGSILGIADADAFGALARSPTLVVETGEFAVRKLRALTCHRSQLTASALALVGDEDAPRLLGTEHYRRAEVGARGASFLDRFSAPHAVGAHPPRR